jgi:hypothetical protein
MCVMRIASDGNGRGSGHGEDVVSRIRQCVSRHDLDVLLSVDDTEFFHQFDLDDDSNRFTTSIIVSVSVIVIVIVIVSTTVVDVVTGMSICCPCWW